MKQILCCVALLFSTISWAKVWRVNNTGAPADFTNAQSAHNGAASGDTLHFESSSAPYGHLNVTKKIYLIGTGYILGTLSSNANPDLQANPAAATLNTITFSAGSDGSMVQGVVVMSGISISASQIVVRRCLSQASITFGPCNNVQIIGNIITGFAGIAGDGNPNTNLQINNNIIGNNVSFGPEDNGDFMNNVMTAYAGGTVQLYNFRVWNNISVYGFTAMTNCDIRNNIAHATEFSNTDGNKQNITMSNVFEDFPNTSPLFSEDSRWKLKAGSPAIGAATPSGDCGAFGSAATGSSYVISGIPNIPAIYKLQAPSNTTSNTINITLSTRVNQ